MLCDSCGHDKSRVLKTYLDIKTGAIIRVRECIACGHVWRTREIRLSEDVKTESGKAMAM